jgi:hypothetical protein
MSVHDAEMSHRAPGQRMLDLRLDCLMSPNRADVAAVEVMMLWPKPEDEDWRRRVFQAVLTEHLIATGAHPIPEDAAELKLFYDSVIDFPSKAERTSAAKDAVVEGMQAGMYLLNEIEPGEREHDLKQMMSDRLKAIKRTSPKTFENKIWPTYRCVAAFWAAWLNLNKYHPGLAFPCSVQLLGEFLATAEHYRRRGESHKMKQSRWPWLLPVTEMVRIPQLLELPQSTAALPP